VFLFSFLPWVITLKGIGRFRENFLEFIGLVDLLPKAHSGTVSLALAWLVY